MALWQFLPASIFPASASQNFGAEPRLTLAEVGTHLDWPRAGVIAFMTPVLGRLRLNANDAKECASDPAEGKAPVRKLR